MMKLIKQYFNFTVIPKYAEEGFTEYYIRSDRLMLIIMLLHWAVATFITSITYDTYLYGFIGGALISTTLLFAYHYLKGTPALRVLMGISLMLYSLIFIQQHFGRIEMHFHIFIAMGLLTVYKDFLPIVAAAATTIVHHLIFNYLQLYEINLFDMPVMIFNYGCGIDVVLLHATFVIIEAIALAYIVKLQVEHSIALHLTEKEVLELNAELEYSSMHDNLTGLPNRHNLEQQMKYVIANARRYDNKFAVLFLDLDHFKNINDTLGHDVGDVLLQTIAEKVKPNLRQNDIITRIGGDEFILVLVDVINTNSIVYIAQKILNIFRNDLIVKGHTLRVSASIGIAIYPDDSNNLSELMKYADMAMYKAKENGRDDFSFFTAKIDQQVHEEVDIITHMEAAIIHEEFKLFYQPKIDIKTGRIIGAEALIRWEHPDKGLIFPDKFISLAENTGLILKIGPYVIEHTARMINRLNQLGFDDIALSVNVSTRQFQKGNLYQDIQDSITKHQISAHQLAIEITESVMVKYVDSALKILENIKKLGIQVYMDDFGTGYSSLAYLKKFPIDSLKIDKVFVDDIQENGNNESLLLNAIIAMGNTLNLEVIAEGVEDQYQIDYLFDQGCQFYQGYFFSKAIPEKDFIQLLEKTNNSSK